MLFLSFLVGVTVGAVSTLVIVSFALSYIRRMSNYERGFQIENEDVRVEKNVFSEN